MAPGAKLYTITDVEELGIWMVRAGEDTFGSFPCVHGAW